MKISLHCKVLVVNRHAILFFVRISLLPQRLTIFQCTTHVPHAGSFFSCTRTATECSYVMEDFLVPPEAQSVNAGWRALMVHGPLDFALTGILASIANPLAAAGISIFAVSTFDTDYVLIQESHLGAGVKALRDAGHEVSEL